MSTRNLLYAKTYQINDKIGITIPTVGEIIDDEDNYYDIVTILTAMPVDLMVQLDDKGIDFTTINEYDLFLLLFPSLLQRDTSLVFGDLDLSAFQLAVNEENGSVALIDRTRDIKIDRVIHGQIAGALRKIHHLEKNRRKPANQEAKEFLLQRARAKQKRRKKRIEDSQLESLIIAMVNAEQYKYNFEGTRELSIYQFNECVRQIIKKVDYDNRMHGVFAGTINVKELSQEDMTWLPHQT